MEHPKVDIDGVTVWFFHRDVRYVTDRERRQLEHLVADEKKQWATVHTVQEIVVMTDYLGPGMRFQVTTHHHHNEEADNAAVSGEGDV